MLTPRIGSRLGLTEITALIMLVDGIGLSIVLPYIPFYVLQLGGDAQLVALLFAVFTLAGFFAAPVIGQLSDQHGVRRILCLSLLGTIVSYLGMIVSGNLLMLFVFRALGGAMTGRDAVLQALISAEGSQAARARRVGFATSAGLVGAAAGPTIAALIGLVIHNQPVEIMATLTVGLTLSAGALAVSALSLPRRPTGVSVPVVGRLKILGDLDALREQAIPILTRVGLNYGIGLAFAINTMFLFSRFGWRASSTAWLIGITALLGAAGRGLVAQPAIRMFGTKGALLGAIAVGAAAFVGMALSATALIYAVLFALYIMVHNVALVCNLLQISDRAPPARRGLAFGVVQSAGGLTLAVSASLSGYLFVAANPRAPYFAAAVVLLLTLAAMAVAFGAARRKPVQLLAD